MNRTGSQAQILRSTSIIGASTVTSMLMGLVRSKVVALLLGPTGVGTIGLFNSLLTTATNLGTLGLGTSGVRHIAEVQERDDPAAVAAARRALLIGMFIIGLAAGALVFALRGPLAGLLMGDAARSGDIGWLSLGVALGVAATSQNAVLNGLRRVGDIARVAILSAVVTTVAGLAIVALWGRSAIVFYVLTTPIATFLVGHWYVSRIAGGGGQERQTLAQSLACCASLARLGIASLTTLFLMSGGLLVVRALIHTRLGSAPLGLFEASWGILNAYLGAVLVAMGTDFYPRLVATIKRPEEACLLVNEQTRIALWLAGPLCVAIIGFAPLIIGLLFSSRFVGAADVLRVMVIGDIFKLMAWPLGFVLMAKSDGRRLVIGEVIMVGTLIAVAWLGLERIGLVAVGVGYATMYALFALVAGGWTRRAISFRWDPLVLREAAVLFACACATLAASRVSEGWAMAVGGVLSLILGLVTLRHLGRLIEAGGPLGRVARRLRDWAGRATRRD